MEHFNPDYNDIALIPELKLPPPIISAPTHNSVLVIHITQSEKQPCKTPKYSITDTAKYVSHS